MKILAIDTATDLCSVSLSLNNKIVDTKHALRITNPKEYNLPMFDVNTEYIVAKDKSYFVYNNDYHKYVNMLNNTFQHGGISLDEMLVPLIELEPKK